jgi:uncharacterized CHY-type Zn-finger protein
MSLISSYFIEPVVRAGRRLSFGTGAAPVPPASNAAPAEPLSHANQVPSSTAPPQNGGAEADSEALAARDAPQSPDGRPAHLLERIRRYSSFTRRPNDVVVDEELEMGDDEGAISATTTTTTTATAPIAVPSDAANMSANPSRPLEHRLRSLDLDPPVSSAPAASPAVAGAGLQVGTAGQNAGMSESLPADDGFTYLRARIHEIRALDIPEQTRAQMVHGLMIERYNHMRPTSPSSFVSHDRPVTPSSAHSVFSEYRASSPLSAASEVDTENPYNLRSGDTSPSYRSIEHNEDDDEEDQMEEELVLGCKHYRRNVKVQCYDCRHWYTCRHCHDEIEDHALNRKATQNMLCMACGTPQKASDTCKKCGIESACYYCDICKLWDNNPRKKIYHCPDCGICRRGAGLGKDYTHCQVSPRAPNPAFPFSHRAEMQCLHNHITCRLTCLHSKGY